MLFQREQSLVRKWVVSANHLTMATSKKHPGFKAVQSSIAKKQGISQEAAGAILAASSRKASPSAKAKNPRLKKVKGK